jgi:hypothetical protein
MILLICVTGCVNAGPNEAAVCAATKDAARDHAAILADADEAVLRSGAVLIARLDAACGVW